MRSWSLGAVLTRWTSEWAAIVTPPGQKRARVHSRPHRDPVGHSDGPPRVVHHPCQPTGVAKGLAIFRLGRSVDRERVDGTPAALPLQNVGVMQIAVKHTLFRARLAIDGRAGDGHGLTERSGLQDVVPLGLRLLKPLEPLIKIDRRSVRGAGLPDRLGDIYQDVGGACVLATLDQIRQFPSPQMLQQQRAGGLFQQADTEIPVQTAQKHRGFRLAAQRGVAVDLQDGRGSIGLPNLEYLGLLPRRLDPHQGQRPPLKERGRFEGGQALGHGRYRSFRVPATGLFRCLGLDTLHSGCRPSGPSARATEPRSARPRTQGRVAAQRRVCLWHGQPVARPFRHQGLAKEEKFRLASRGGRQGPARFRGPFRQGSAGPSGP